MKNKGISLIVLVITIVVIIILATAVIVQLSNNDMITNANKAIFLQDLSSMQDELTVYVGDNGVDSLGEFESEELSADYSNIYQNWNQPANGNVYTVLPDLNKSKLDKKIQVQEGEIVYIGSEMTDEEIEWAEEAGLKPARGIDISILTALVQEARIIKTNINDYQDTGKQTFLNILVEAEKVLITPISQSNVNKYIVDLGNAMNALQKKVPPTELDLTRLQVVIDIATEIFGKIDLYLPEGKADFLISFQNAKDVMKNPISQSNIDNARQDLNVKMSRLRYDPDKVDINGNPKV